MSNEWIKGELIYEENLLDNGELEISILVSNENVSYKLIGKLDKDEMIKIVENLSY